MMYEGRELEPMKWPPKVGRVIVHESNLHGLGEPNRLLIEDYSDFNGCVRCTHMRLGMTAKYFLEGFGDLNKWFYFDEPKRKRGFGKFFSETKKKHGV